MDLHFKEFGEGKPLVVLHGLYGMSDNWISIARMLQENNRVILIDLRNHGQSLHSNEHNYELMADDVLQLMSGLDIYGFRLLGHSMGGKVAMMMAALSPERIEKLVVVDISPRTYSISEGDVHLHEHKSIIGSLLSLDLTQFSNRQGIDIALQEKIQQDRIRAFLLKNIKRNKQKAFEWKMNLNAIAKNIDNIMAGLEPYAFDLQMFTNETLFIIGAESLYVKEHDEKIIKQLFVNAQIKKIANAGHWLHAEQPEVFIDEINSFLPS